MNYEIHDRPREINQISRWALMLALIPALLTGAYALIYYAGQEALTETSLAGQMPENYRETVRALITASGHSCNQVCGVSAIVGLAGDASLRVTCGSPSASGRCEVDQRYSIAVTPTREPRR